MQQTEPVIIATGITVEEKAATFEFRRRGFVVEHVSQQPSSSNYALTMSKRLVAKIALGLHLPQGPFKKYSRFHQAYIASQAAEVIAHSAGLHVSECWVAHDMADPVMAEGAAQLPSGELLLAANNYFGPQVAIYFGFLDFYTRKLVPLMLVGAVVFVYQVLFGQVDTPLLPVFCVTISLWTTYFLQSWKRRCSELAYAWGVYGSEDKEFIAELA
ncbi:calcium-activated chloride channel-domain-containing protein, partial [Ochromonadaceae sp. CCMP2298]